MKPIIKWVGGKTDNLHELLPLITQNQYEEYYEPFCGGGAVFLAVIQHNLEKGINVKYNISDINETLIYMYNAVKNNPNDLIEELEKLDRFSEEYYYETRKKYNESNVSVAKAALFIYLNKTCFRGLYRESKNGFNVPYGNYKNPTIFKKNDILQMSEIFNQIDITFTSCSFTEVKFSKNCLAYFDPPYYPVTKSSFTEYNKNPFRHDLLGEICKNADFKFVLSNSNCTYVKNTFPFTIREIVCKRRINSKNPAETAGEVIITN